jgi:hypothetical protein
VNDMPASDCPVCGEGTLSDASCEQPVQINGLEASIWLRMSTCTTCGCDQASDVEVEANRLAMRALRQKLAAQEK